MKSIQKHKPHLEISFDFRLLYFIKIKYKTMVFQQSKENDLSYTEMFNFL